MGNGKFGIKLVGDWDRAHKILQDKRTLVDAIDKAVKAEAQVARGMIVKGIRNQAPAGRQFRPLSPMTLMLRKLKKFRGTKALIVTGTLIGSITTAPAGKGRTFVGVLRSAKTKDGKGLVNIAAVHEFGKTFVIRVTPKMRAFLMAAMTKAKYGSGDRVKGGRDQKGRFLKDKFVSTGKGQLSRGVIVIKIPARPFIGPVIEQIMSDPEGLRRRLGERLAKNLKFTFGSM